MNTAAQPMAAPMAAPMSYQPIAENKVVSSKGWFIAKLVLGGFIVVFDIILIGICAGLLSAYPIGAALFDFLMGFCPAIVSLGWQVAEFITVCVHRDHRGIHPGAHVGLHLVLWLSFVIDMSFVALEVDYHYSCSTYRSCYYSSSVFSSSSFDNFRSMEVSIAAFMALLTILHFILFVRFCIETNRRNRMPSGIYMVGAPGMPAPGMYFMPPAGMPMQQPYMMPGAPGQYAPPPMMQYQPGPPGSAQQAAAAHTSMYGGFFASQQQPPQQPQQNGGGVEPKSVAPPTTTSPAPAMSEVSAEASQHHSVAPANHPPNPQ